MKVAALGVALRDAKLAGTAHHVLLFIGFHVENQAHGQAAQRIDEGGGLRVGKGHARQFIGAVLRPSGHRDGGHQNP